MYSELWQFGAMFVFFAVALSLWLKIVYLPGRTLERWEDQRVKADGERTRQESSAEERRRL
jgi:hypothetical protein